ncbi:type II secretion system secretin GspD [Thiorhodospira sibirica]|uniref:type II secretion system secretin GspD n=1 Tax=Thiorhodospira sibirica TaxID=154347 RepID=UPI00022C52BD|nr:type II secretion system secretin GspD [Thiorhodospira sibirica]
MSFRLSRALATAVLLLGLLLTVPGTAQDSELLTLNFKDVDIQAVINYVSEETGINFIVDPRIRARVTLVSGRAVTRDELYDIFLSLLRVHGFAAVPGEGVTKLLPDALAKQSEVPTIDHTPRPSVRGDAYITRVIEIKHIDAAQLVPILRPLLPQSGHLAASPESNTLIIADTAVNVQRLVEIVARVDQAVVDEFEVIPLRYASASEIVRILENIKSGDPGRQRPGSRLQLAADERTNSIILSAEGRMRFTLRALISHLDIDMDTGNIQVVYLRYANAEQIARVLEGLASSLLIPGDGPPGGTQINIQAHESTNAIVLSGPPDVLRDLRLVIQQLDVRRAQVLVEAVIAEVSYERATELGVQWGIGSNQDGLGIVNFGRSGTGIVSLANSINAFLSGTTTATTAPNPGDGLSLGGLGRTGSTRIAMLVRALSQDSSSNILSTPSLLTMDNEEAEIVVGQNVPFISGRTVEQSGQAFDTIQRQDVGVKLVVRPQINEGNSVKLEIEQEVSQVAPSGSTQGAADLVTNKRSLRTSVIVDDGEMVVLGGLIDDVLTQTQQRVPGLGAIPGVGRLFRYESANKQKRNLMIFLHPVIVRERGAQQHLTTAKYNFIRTQQINSRQQGVLMMPEDTVPVLPAWDELLELPPPFETLAGTAHSGNNPPVVTPPPWQ